MSPTAADLPAIHIEAYADASREIDEHQMLTSSWNAETEKRANRSDFVVT